MKYLLILSLAVLYVSAHHQLDTVVKKVNLEVRYISINTDIKFEAEHKHKVFFHAVPLEYEDLLTSVVVRDNENIKDLKVSKAKKPPQQEFKDLNLDNYAFYKIELLEDGPQNLEIREVYKRRILPLPKEIALREEQLVKFDDNKYFLSVYPAATMKTIV